jgi:hypothetical protein
LHFQFGFSYGAIVTLKKSARSVANIRQSERERVGFASRLCITARAAAEFFAPRKTSRLPHAHN